MVAAWVGAKTNLDEVVMEVILLVIHTYVYGVYLQQQFVLVYIRGGVVQHRQLHALIHEELGVCTALIVPGMQLKPECIGHSEFIHYTQ